jgi:hypothetical protein
MIWMLLVGGAVLVMGVGLILVTRATHALDGAHNPDAVTRAR